MQSPFLSLASFSLTYAVLEFIFKIIQDILGDALREWAKKSPLAARLLILGFAFFAYFLIVNKYVESIIPPTPPVAPQPIPPQRTPQEPSAVPPSGPSAATPPTSVPPKTSVPISPPVPKPRVAVTLDSALTPYKRDIEGILNALPLRNGNSVAITMNMETYDTPDMPGAEPATINVIVEATAMIKSSSGSIMKTLSLPRYKVTQPLRIITNTDAFIRDRVKSATNGFKNTISEGL